MGSMKQTKGQLLTVAEAAERLEVSRSTVYRWAHQGLIRAVRYGRPFQPGQSARGGAIRIPSHEIDARTGA